MEYDSIDQMDAQDSKLAKAALEAMKNAYAPYSNFHVGAAVMFDDGEIVKGSNQENAAYPSGICAERTAMFHAGATRPEGVMISIAVAGGLKGELADQPATPCGACRQVMAQYQLKGGKPMSVILVGASKIWKFEKVDDILPLMFDSIETFCRLKNKRCHNIVASLLYFIPLYEKRESLIHRTATTSYPCCDQALGEFRGSWSCMTFPMQR